MAVNKKSDTEVLGLRIKKKAKAALAAEAKKRGISMSQAGREVFTAGWPIWKGTK